MPEFEHTGQYLRKLRTDKGLTIKEVMKATRISELNLNAIEQQDFQTLPADTFTRGFLSLYARFLGANPAEVVQRFMEERDAGKPGGKRPRLNIHTGQHILTPKTMAEPSQFSSLTAAIILLTVIIFFFTAFCLYTSWNPFSFMVSSSKDKDFEYIMTGLEQSYPVSPDNIGTSDQAVSGSGADEAAPSENQDSQPPAANGPINEYTLEGAALLSSDEGLSLPAGQPAAGFEKINGSAVFSYSEDRQSLPGDE
ncbi:MAG: helix-turn-helix domain-containing protein [Desulfobulbaceae bacterium]|nr:helix-turn-helix domain-containing protein [Desulfobulbaceae bacterium]